MPKSIQIIEKFKAPKSAVLEKFLLGNRHKDEKRMLTNEVLDKLDEVDGAGKKLNALKLPQ